EALEAGLAALRVLRREETCLGAVLALGGAVPFEALSAFLSALAEAIAQRALALARRGRAAELSVIGLGKIAGREFTYHSDLDLVFLHEGGPAELAEASRVGQRLISYLTTMTGAGVAYAVDTRLRPSGRQGALVTSLEGFERYQTRQAETWEHLALLRSRAIAGRTQEGQAALDRVRGRSLAAAGAPWPSLAPLRQRVHAERGGESKTAPAIKAGPGGLMDVDFLAEGGVLERCPAELPPLPAIPALLRAARDGAGAEALLEDYAFLRRVESRARWVAGRAVEAVDLAPPAGPLVAELVAPGLAPGAPGGRLAAPRARMGAPSEAVLAAGPTAALPGGARPAGAAPRPPLPGRCARAAHPLRARRARAAPPQAHAAPHRSPRER